MNLNRIKSDQQELLQDEPVLKKKFSMKDHEFRSNQNAELRFICFKGKFGCQEKSLCARYTSALPSMTNIN